MRPSTEDQLDRAIRGLSKRRGEVLGLVARGLTNPDIAAALDISLETARSHMTYLLRALQVSNRTEAATAYQAWADRGSSGEPVLARPAVAVLPILTADPTSRGRVAAAGMTRDLEALFSRWCWFPVVSCRALDPGWVVGKTAKAIGQELDARFLVSGSLTRAKKGFHLDVQAVDATTGHAIWSEGVALSSRTFFDVEERVAAAIVANAYPRLIAVALPELRPVSRPERLATWEVAHLAFAMQHRRERDAHAQAQELFSHALRREPKLVLAHYGQGLVAYDAILNQWGPKAEAVARLERSAEVCLELAPHMAEGHFLAGRAHLVRHDGERAARELEAAIARNPSFAAAHAVLAQVLLVNGRLDEGLARMKIGERLGPRSYVAGLAWAHFARHEWSLALAAAEQALAVRAKYPFGRAIAAAAAYWLGDLARARAHAEALYLAQPEFCAEHFRDTFGPDLDAVLRIAEALRAIG